MFNGTINKNVLFGMIAAAVLLVGGIVFVVVSGGGSSPGINGSSETSDNKTVDFTAVKACSALTLDEAKQLLGNDATEINNTGEVTSGDISVDNCSYTNNATKAADIRIVTVTARSALTDSGQDSNIGAFEKNGTANPRGASAVSGLGKKAYWDPAARQLTILKGTTWYSIVYGSTNPANNTLDDAKKAAELLLN